MGHERVPQGLKGPVEVVLTRPAQVIPLPSSMPGGAHYDMKWDGYRLVVVNDGGAVTLWSRRGSNLTGRFPELVHAAAQHVPAGSVLDGEVVAWVQDRTSFEALATRMSLGEAKAAAAARRSPVSYVAFDLLALAGHDVRPRPLLERRALLADVASSWSPALTLCPQTSEVNLARAWFDELTVAGIEGLVVKAGAGRYRGGARDWVKVKHRQELDVVAGAVLGSLQRPTVVVAGLPFDGQLRIVGRTVPVSVAAAAELATQLRAGGPGHPWPEQVTSVAVSGFAGPRRPVQLVRVEPVVVEVAADVAWSGRTFRHPLRLLRVRPDLDPADVGPPA